MRVLGIFMILGCLSSVIAQEETDNISLPINRSETSGSAPGQIEGPQEGGSDKNGGPTAYNSITSTWQSFSNCIRSLVNVTELEADKAAVFSKREWDNFTKKYCHKVPNLVQCLDHLVDRTNHCLDEEDEEVIQSFHNITNSYLGLLCQNDGDRLASFLNIGAEECF